jgi:hypothetical protein
MLAFDGRGLTQFILHLTYLTYPREQVMFHILEVFELIGETHERGVKPTFRSLDKASLYKLQERLASLGIKVILNF